jgi:hypothetical protein
MDSALMAALVGALGSIVGGLVGGWLAIVASRRQRERDLAASRASRSHEAAMAIAGAVASMQEALVEWLEHPDGATELRRGYNTVSRTVGMQSMALTDPGLRPEVQWHMDQIAEIARLAAEDTAEAHDRAEVLNRGIRDLLDALDAHYNDQAFPLYVRPKLDAVPVVAWEAIPTLARRPLVTARQLRRAGHRRNKNNRI